jgi:hypothetical protein
MQASERIAFVLYVSGTEIGCVLKEVEVLQLFGTIPVTKSDFPSIPETAGRALWPKEASHSDYHWLGVCL